MHGLSPRHGRFRLLIGGVVLLVSAGLFLAAGPAEAKPKKGVGLVCGSTVTADVVLNADMHCSGTAIVVGASGITVDLNKHELTGGDTGIVNNGFDNVIVKDGTLRFLNGIVYNGVNGGTIANLNIPYVEPVIFSAGISLNGSQHVTVIGNHIRNPSFGGVDSDGHHNTWINNTVDDIGFFDRQVGFGGIFVGSPNTTVLHNTISGNCTCAITASLGVFVSEDMSASGTAVTDNTLTNLGTGVFLADNSTGITVNDNKINDNIVGLDARSPHSSAYFDNTVYHSSAEGIFLQAPTNVTVENNSTNNNLYGISITGTAGAIPIGNTANSNKWGISSDVPINAGNVTTNRASGNREGDCINLQPCI